MTISEAVANLSALGIKRGFRPVIEADTGAVLLKTRRPAEIVGGELQGCEIVQCAGGFKAWTAQARKARKLAERYGLKVRLWDGEAEMIVPAALADEILPQLGARVRRELSEEQRQGLRARLAGARNALNLGSKAPEERSSSALTAQERHIAQP